MFPVSQLCPAADVTLKERENTIELSNEVLSTSIEKSSGRITSVKLGGQELLGSGTGYWSASAFRVSSV